MGKMANGFVVQDSIQGYHWSNDQATVHPFVCYYRKPDEIELSHINYVVISDSRSHDTVAVHHYLGKIIPDLKRRIGAQLSKIFYFTDGAVAQYKNRKNFINLVYHEDDFGVAAEWHFFATSHGKGPCDGLGGTVKRRATVASLQNPLENHILTPKDLYIWAQKNLGDNITYFFVEEAAVDTEKRQLEERFDMSKRIVGTHKFHSFIPVPGSRLFVYAKRYSSSDTSSKVTVSK